MFYFANLGEKIVDLEEIEAESNKIIYDSDEQQNIWDLKKQQ